MKLKPKQIAEIVNKKIPDAVSVGVKKTKLHVPTPKQVKEWNAYRESLRNAS